MRDCYKICLLLFFLFPSEFIFGQVQVSDSNNFKKVIAGPEYKRSASFRNLWGTNRRKEWTTSVNAPLLWLDSIPGDIAPYKGGGGGNETKSLRLRTKDGKEYVLRSINKSRDEVIPNDVKGTFMENIIQDGVSMSHPYGALALAGMQDAAGIYHTNPRLVFLPSQKALDTFNTRFSDDLYMFEERPDEDWSGADHLGNFENYSGTDKVIENLLEDIHNKANQFAFVKTRLFDIMIGDWDRHADNFRWGRKDSLGYRWYEPVPRDRDQTFFSHDGFFIDRMIKISGFGFMKHFSEKIEDVDDVPAQQKDLDQFFANALTKEDWLKAATALENSITDTVIDQSLKGMPPEIYDISGKELLEKLITRRAQLQYAASEYYAFLAKEVIIPLSVEAEHVLISSPAMGQTKVEVFAIDKNRNLETQSLYTRIFNSSETETIKIYGIKGEDVYTIRDNADIKIHLYAGPHLDSFIQTGGNNILIYDTGLNFVNVTNAVQKLSSKDKLPLYHFTARHTKRKTFTTTPYLFFSQHKIYQRAVGLEASLRFPNTLGKWDAEFTAYFSPIKWNNYFGTGNESTLSGGNNSQYQFTSVEWGAKAGLTKKSGNSLIGIYGLYHRSKSNQDSAGYLYKNINYDTAFGVHQYAGGQVKYSYISLNNNVLPTRGLIFKTAGGYIKHFKQKGFFQDYSAKLHFYIPVFSKFSIAIKGGGTIIAGIDSKEENGQVYQYSIVGGAESIRGFRANRFWGRSAFYNQNEFRFITDFKSYLLNAKIGAFLFADNGRVWLPEESSNKIHHSYGAGFILVPFYKLNCSLTYGISPEAKLFQFTMNTGL